MPRALDVTSSVLATLASLAGGARVGSPGARPEKPLALYEFEGCPFCRKVREALSVLDLDADVYPCPKNGPRFRPWVREHGGKAQFPYLVDPNTGREMYESDDITRYLFAEYGSGAPSALLAGPLATATAALAGAFRPGLGSFYRAARAPERPLELYSFEASPFARIAREALCTLELPYRLHNVAKGSAQREAFAARAGKVQVPWLVDPNTDVQMFESADIVAYLTETYALGG
jgi:glutathione S-transferase